MDGGGEEERLKAEKCHVDERKEEVIGDGKYHGFGQRGPERQNGSVRIARVQLPSILGRAGSFHGLNGG